MSVSSKRSFLSAIRLVADEAIGLPALKFVDLKNTERNPSALYEGFIAKGIDLSIELRNFYKDTKSPKLTLFYGGQNPVDVDYAAHMEGLPNVTLRPLEGEYSHSVLPNLILSGRFQKVIQAM